MDDIKLFEKKEQVSLIKTIIILNTDSGMEKCDMLIIKSGKRLTTQ